MATLAGYSYFPTIEETPSAFNISRLFSSFNNQCSFVVNRVLVGKSKWITVSHSGFYRVLETPVDPRMPFLRASDYAAIQEYLSEGLPVPIPRVLAYDSGTDNHILAPYLIRECPRGVPLSVYGGFNQQDHCEIIPQLGDLILSIQQRIQSLKAARILKADWIPEKSLHQLRVPGTLFGTMNLFPQTQIKLCPFTAPGHASVPTFTYTSLSELLQLQLLAWGMTTRPADLTSKVDGRNLSQLIQGMKMLGFFSDDQPNALWYRGLDESNLFVTRINGKVRITSITGWNEVVSVPRSLAREDPIWFENIKYQEASRWNSRKVKVALDEYLEWKSPGWISDAKEFGSLVRIVATFALGDTSLENLARIWSIPDQGFFYSHSHFHLPRDFIQKLLQEWKCRYRNVDTTPDLLLKISEVKAALQNHTNVRREHILELETDKYWTPQQMFDVVDRHLAEQQKSCKEWLNQFAISSLPP